VEKGLTAIFPELDFTEEQRDRLAHCVECPRQCGVNRFDVVGYCRTGVIPKVASVNLHYGEEPPISGDRGSGTVFLCGCNMSCLFCQNFPISQLGHGRELTLEGFVDAMLGLESRGAHNINFVTPSHATVLLEAIIPEARRRGLSVPIVYNSSGYDSIESLKRLDGLIEIYLPDIRYADATVAEKLSDAPDYPNINSRALIEMHRQVGDLVLDDHGIAVRGMIVRHLVLPGGLANTESALDFIRREISPEAHVALMAQYFPAHNAQHTAEIDRRITRAEWRAAVDVFEASGLDGWAQEL